MDGITIQASHKPANQVRIGFCVPMRGMIDVNFMAGFLNLFLHFMQKPNVLPIPIFSENITIDGARNELAKQAIISQCDYTLWLDADIVVHPAQIDHMWNALHELDSEGMKREVITGIYYQRAPPYHPVLRRFHKYHRYFDPENFMTSPVIEYPKDRLFEVDGTGMGCVLMRNYPLSAVFNDTKGHPFQTISDRVSEDLFFFGKLREGVKDHHGNLVKFKVWCDPEVQCAHYGANVTQWHYLHSQKDRYMDVDELAAYMKDTPETALQKCLDASLDIAEQWIKRFGPDQTKYDAIPEADIDDFYQNLDYRYDLTFYWFNDSGRRESLLARAQMPLGQKFSCLDFGCGIGDFGMNIAERYPESKVVFYDINKKNMEYLMWRLARRQSDKLIGDEQVWVIDKKEHLSKLKDVKFQLIFCLDVLEHMKEPVEAINWLREHLDRNGILICNIAPKQPGQPQHISSPKMEDYGFVQLDEKAYVLPESDIAMKVKEFKEGGSAKKG